jgi:hypothetical protein
MNVAITKWLDTLSDKVLLAGLLITFLIFGAACFFVGYNLKQCPQVTYSKGSVRDSQVIKPGISDSSSISRDSVKVTIKPVIKPVRIQSGAKTVVSGPDTTIPGAKTGISGPEIVDPDTAHCYSWGIKEKDGAIIKCEACSKKFAAVPPLDLSTSINYLSRSDTTHFIKETDTARILIKSFWDRPAVKAICAGLLIFGTYRITKAAGQ